jgi:hypothetical protein
MPGMEWLAEHWFEAMEAVGVVAALLYHAHVMSWDERSTRVTNLIALTREHRELWTEISRRADLARLSGADADLRQRPVTDDEALFVALLIQHLHATYQAMRQGVFVEVDGLRADVRAFLALPIPAALWPALRPLQNKDFAAFVESCRATK